MSRLCTRADYESQADGRGFITNDLCNDDDYYLSSPRAESARAATGRLCPHSGEGEAFFLQNFFTETAVTPERKV